ncbi:MAG: enoyl-CoA hydratase [Planctomycetota bacterium]|nr:MAG: enoyl-CoA hydratase [Planctomycetota bacterium]
MEISQLSDTVVLLRMDTGKANAISPEFLNALGLALDAFEGSASPALVITGSERFFSAGLDLVSLIEFDASQLKAHMQRFDDIVSRLFLLGRPVIAAVNGHAIAGGCVLAMTADVRVGAAGKWRMGMNETTLGLGLPVAALVPSQFALPTSAFARALLAGELFAPDDARQLGLLDELVPAEELIEQAQARAEALAKIPLSAFADTKRRLREPTLQAARAASPRDLDSWVDVWFEPVTQARLKAAVAALRKR